MREQLFVRFHEVTPFDEQTAAPVGPEHSFHWILAIERDQLARVRPWGSLLAQPKDVPGPEFRVSGETAEVTR